MKSGYKAYCILSLFIAVITLLFCAAPLLFAADQASVEAESLLQGVISGYCFNDENQNGTMDESEEGLPGVSVSLTRIFLFIFPIPAGTVETDAEGQYEFTDLGIGSYAIEAGVAEGSQCTTANPVRTWLGIFQKTFSCNFGLFQGQTADVFDDYVVDPETYALEPNPGRILSVMTTLPSGSAAEVEFPSDQMVLLMVEDTPRSEVERIAAELGGSIVGQVPIIDFFQIELANAVTQDDLDAALAQARLEPSVAGAYYNLLARHTAECPAQSDLEGLWGSERCPFSDIDYYQALTMFEEFKPGLTLHRVRVAVIDTGINTQNGEFDDVRILNLDVPGRRITDSDGHGTLVAGIIAADDDDKTVNGIASRFLKDNLQLLYGGTAVGAFATYLSSTKRAADAKANVVNLSLGWIPSMVDADFLVCRTAWERLFAAYPNILFVVAADNSPYEITTTNYAPGGIQLDNVITVGGTDNCSPLEAYPDSATGPLVDIAAPAVLVPTLTSDPVAPAISYATGNSVATPQVVSVAAILRSLDPSLSAAQTKNDYLRQYCFPTAASVSSRRLSLSVPMEQLLLDLIPSVSRGIAETIDRDSDGRWDPPGMVINRICGGLNFSVDGYGQYDYVVGNQEAEWVWGVISSESFKLLTPVNRGSTDAQFTLDCDLCTFAIGTTYAILGNNHPGTAQMSFVQNQSAALLGEASFGVGSEDLPGEITIDSCSIEGRDPAFNQPLWVEVEGSFEGVLDMVDPPDFTPARPSSIQGSFGFLFSAAALIGTGSPLVDYLEQNCRGGIVSQ